MTQADRKKLRYLEAQLRLARMRDSGVFRFTFPDRPGEYFGRDAAGEFYPLELAEEEIAGPGLTIGMAMTWEECQLPPEERVVSVEPAPYRREEESAPEGFYEDPEKPKRKRPKWPSFYRLPDGAKAKYERVGSWFMQRILRGNRIEETGGGMQRFLNFRSPREAAKAFRKMPNSPEGEELVARQFVLAKEAQAIHRAVMGFNTYRRPQWPVAIGRN